MDKLKAYYHNLKASPLAATRLEATLLWCCFVGCALTGILGLWGLFCVVIALLFVSVVVLPRMFWRCPSCGNRLPLNRSPEDMPNCPYCGEELK